MWLDYDRISLVQPLRFPERSLNIEAGTRIGNLTTRHDKTHLCLLWQTFRDRQSGRSHLPALRVKKYHAAAADAGGASGQRNAA